LCRWSWLQDWQRAQRLQLASNLAHGYAQHDMRSHCDLLKQAHRCSPPRATAERIAKAIAQDAHKVEKVLFEREQVLAEAAGVTVGLDRTSAPTAEALPMDAPHADTTEVLGAHFHRDHRRPLRPLTETCPSTCASATMVHARR
jgi:hypothetical protein